MQPRLLPIVILSALACSTVGVSRDDQPWAEVEPTIANEIILDHKEIIVIDLRPVADFYGELGHIAGAISVPILQIDQRLPEIIPYRSQTIIVYSDLPEDAIRGARILTAAGFRNIVVIKGGIRRWLALNYKTVRSRDQGSAIRD